MKKSESREKKLLIDTVIYAFGDLMPKAISFFLIPIYTAVLLPEEYGMYDYIMTIFQVLSPIITMQMPGTVMIFILTSSNQDKKKIISTGMFTSLYMVIFTIAISLVMFLALNWDIRMLFLIIYMYISNMYWNFFAQILRGFGKVKFYSIIGIITTLSNLLLSIMFVVYLKMSYQGIILASSLAYTISIIIITKKLKIKEYISSSHIDKGIRKDMLNYAIPLIPNSISWWIIGMSDRLIIRYYMSLEAIGIYSVASKLSQIITLLYHTFDKAWLVSAATAYNSPSREKFFTDVFSKISSLVFLSVGLIIAFLPQIMSVWVSDLYFSSWKYSGFLIMSMIFYCFAQFYGVAYNCSKKTKQAFYSTMLAGSVNIIVNLALIRKYGLYAAAISTLIAYMILWIYRVYSTKNYFPIKMNQVFIIINLALITLILLSNYFENTISLVIRILSMAIIIYINRSFLYDFKNLIKAKNN